MHLGGVDEFSAEEATAMIGELYIERRRDGDRIITLTSMLAEANEIMKQQRQELEELKGGELHVVG